MYKSFFSILSASLIIAGLARAEVTVYQIDPVHSGVSFKVRHHFTKVPGSFATFGGEIHYDADDLAKSKVIATIDAASVNTNSERRDNHLRGEDFFETVTHPEISFESTRWEALGGSKYKVNGDLTMVGKTVPVELAVEFLGEGEGNRGIISGWDATTTLDRDQWGITYGPGIIGDEIAVEINIQAKKQ